LIKGRIPLDETFDICRQIAEGWKLPMRRESFTAI